MNLFGTLEAASAPMSSIVLSVIKIDRSREAACRARGARRTNKAAMQPSRLMIICLLFIKCERATLLRGRPSWVCVGVP